jgi:hypothetical protein
MTIAQLKARDIILILLTVISFLTVFSFDPVGQDPMFHDFADQRSFFGIPNFLNVVTNVPFVIVGVAGLIFFLKNRDAHQYLAAHVILFGSVIAIGFGSAWYHYNPTNSSLVWDRIPMTLTFMSYFSIVVGNYVNRRAGARMLFPALILGVASVLYWFTSEQNGHGDLRLYGWVQFYPMLCIPLILFLYPAQKNVKLKIILVVGIYALAKVAEKADDPILGFHYLISGHSLKHLLASLSVLLILLTVRAKGAKREVGPSGTAHKLGGI